MSTPLNPLTLPLWGSRLIEASAGTGKTWTIAALYLRLVLGHGGDEGFERPLTPAEILVMTFTRAATRELSDRIRSRLLEAARCFRGDDTPEPGDALLIGLLDAYPSGPLRSAGAWRLSTAAESMDDAAVHTIDAWCQRMLREHAFDSGCLFDEELVANLNAMQREAAQDYWRQQLYPLDADALTIALSVWKDVETLADDAGKLVEHAASLSRASKSGADANGSLGDCIHRLDALRRTAMADLKAGWAGRAQEMQTWLEGQLAGKAGPFDKKKLQLHRVTAWVGTLMRWADDPGIEPPVLNTGAARLTPGGLRELMKPDAGPVDIPPVFHEFERLMRDLAALAPLAVGLREHAARSIAARLSDLKQQAGTFGFDDMLSRLDRALDASVNGASAERLRQRIVTQYPVALVDEFQDTSPVQARIFDRLYDVASNDRHTALMMIGDPKQSIYGFRGADIHSYLTARRATEGRHYVLGTNHRSTEAMVAATNHLFATAERRAGEGAFMFRTAGDHAANNPLPFVPVDARGRKESFVTSGGASAALTLHYDDRLLDAPRTSRAFAARCAEQIALLLNDPAAGFDDPQKGFSRLRPADVAVLVRSRIEAAAVRRELRRRRVASVYLSDKESVFQSAEARDLLHWLRAVASPLDARLVRAALATRTVGLSIDELLALAQDDEAFDARSEQLRELHRVWREQGVLTMLRRSLHLLDLPARWLAGDVEGESGGESSGVQDGERRLTNLLHLAELLQAASTLLEGEQALVRWLTQQLADPSAGGDDQIVRLESDADLVKVVTVHKAKGLEYPLVFLPFASGFRAVKNDTLALLSLADEAGGRSLHLAPGPEHMLAAERDRHREDLRLLYVALTRARHVAWVGLAATKTGKKNDQSTQLHRSALGYALSGADPMTAQALAGALEAWAEPCAHIALVSEALSAPAGVTMFRPRGTPVPLREPMPYAAEFDRNWTIGSFSALVRDIASQPSAALAVMAARDDESMPSTAPDALPERAALPSAEAPWHAFPRGATPGNFLHDQLEWLAADGFDQAASPERQLQLARRCERLGWGHRGADVSTWLQRVVTTPLPAVGASLAEIRSPLSEMEFWFPSDGLVSGEVDALCRAHLLHGRSRPALPERNWRGMLMGFADLVFEQGGKYWVLDYKSNHLGPNDGYYTAEHLEASMAAHRYDVQAALYLLALHRLLRTRLGAAYDPATQLGGAVYFFLRGLAAPTRGCYVIGPPVELLDALDASLGLPTGATA